MAKVSLRIYNREIESLIDKNQLDEAVAHCRHILQTFSKHLDTNRLLGKAYLESKRYEEAVDIFSRVLMSVPDDFVSHVGMSIIRDEQNKMDDAIWHMERAFESQPSNAAIQGELQRLFGRRDGMEPPKIRMTRGALAHMYLQGELYPQAISEIKAVLAHDAERDDMRYLLARAYFHAGQKADASDVCAQLLQRYPYSFDANRIMVELLQGSENPQDREAYRQHVNELDPYAAFAHGSVFRSNEVPDETVSLEHLDYRAQDAPYAAEWTPPGIAAAPASGDQPDWLREGYAAPEQPQPAAAEPQPETEIPDFLRAAGWTESTGAAQEPPVLESFAEDEKAAAEIAPGEMPDWLKAMQPKDSELAPVSPEAPAEEPAPAADWLADLRSDASTTEPEAGVPDWLQNIEATEPEAGPASDDFALPDWLKPAAAPSSAADDFSLPDWLQPASETPPGFQPIEPEIPAAATDETIAATTPPVFEPIESEIPAPPVEEAAALFAAERFDAIEPEIPAAAPAEQPFEPEIPSFVAPPVEPARPAASLDTLGTSAQEQDDAMAWLESLAAKHGAKSEELVTDPSARSDKPPEWVEQAMSLGEPKPIIPEPEQPAAPEPEPFQPEPVEPQQEPVPFEFTEPLPAEQVEFIEPLAAGSVELTDIFIEPQPEEPAQPAEPLVQPEAAAEPEPLPFELTDAFIEPKPEESVQPEEPLAQSEPETLAAESPELANVFNEPRAAEPEPAAEPEHIEPALDETGIWLRSLDQKEAPSELEHLDVFASESKTPAADDSMSVLSDWAREAEPSQEAEPTGETAAASNDLPDWLRGVDEDEKWMTPSINTEELPAWLQAEPEPSPLAEPTSPADWHPADVVQESDLTPEEIETVPEPAQDYLLEVEELRARELPPEPEPAFDLDLEAEAPPERSFVSEAEAQEVQPAEPAQAEPQPEERPWPVVEPPAPAAPAPAAHRPPPGRPVAERRQPMPVGADGESVLAQAQVELQRGNIPASLDQYMRLIKRGKYLEEIIRDLRDALYRYPVEVTIWQTLGDAYMRENRLQEALDSYTKAEELLR